MGDLPVWNLLTRIVDRACYAALVLLASAMVAITFLQVLARYVLNEPLCWSEELARYCFIWMVFLGSALATKHGVHIGVDYFVSVLSRTLQAFVGVPVNLAMQLFLIVVIVNSIEVIQFNMSQTSPAIGLPMGIVYLAIPIGATFMLVYVINALIALIGSLVRSTSTGKNGPGGV